MTGETGDKVAENARELAIASLSDRAVEIWTLDRSPGVVDGIPLLTFLAVE